MPWPAITRSSSNACTNVALVASIWPPRGQGLVEADALEHDTGAVVAGRVFAIGESCGMKIVAAIPASRAAHATAWPWLPALAAATLAALSGVSVAIVHRAAILNAPVRCRVLRLQLHGPAAEPRERLGGIDRDARSRRSGPCGLQVREVGAL